MLLKVNVYRWQLKTFSLNYIFFFSVAQKAIKPPSIFSSEEDSYLEGDDADDGDTATLKASNGRTSIARVNQSINSTLKVDEIDSSIYDYDGEYDKFKKAEETKFSSTLLSSSSQVHYFIQLLSITLIRIV